MIKCKHLQSAIVNNTSFAINIDDVIIVFSIHIVHIIVDVDFGRRLQIGRQF